MNSRDQLSSFFWLAISIFVCVVSIQTNIGTLRSPGPGFLPFWAGVTLGTFSIILIIKSILRKKVEERIVNLWKGMEWHKVILVIISLLLYVILLPGLGYLIATFGLLVLLFSTMRRQRPWTQVGSALIIVLATYGIFYLWLDVQLPKGIFGF